MFGNGKTYFAGSPVVIDISGLEWPTDTQGRPTSPFNVVRVEVYYGGRMVGKFPVDTGGQSSISLDISTALRTIWAGYDFSQEVAAARGGGAMTLRAYRAYSLKIKTEYMADDGEFTTTESGEITGGRCMMGRLTERERAGIGAKENADASHWENSNLRNGDASTKPTDTPERVGQDSITSWADVNSNGTQTIFYPAPTGISLPAATGSADGTSAHSPLVLRDSQDYQDFIFINRRGAPETCSALMKESMDVDVEIKQYSRVERPAFKPSRSLMALSEGGRDSWSMSSGYVTREWADWWAKEFLKARQWWMLYEGSYVPVVVKEAKKSNGIYDRSKQQMPHIDFTVTLALEG